jgi:hypothetical protein
MKALLVLGLAVVALSSAASGSAVAELRPPVGSEPIGSKAWPSVAAQLAKNIANASFAHEYDRVWGYLHPAYQKAVSESQWRRCQNSHPAAPHGVTITKVKVSRATELALGLSLLGRQNVQQIELVVEFKTPAVSGPQLAVLSTFWLKQGNKWSAVWLSEEFQSYKAGECYLTPVGPPLY